MSWHPHLFLALVAAFLWFPGPGVLDGVERCPRPSWHWHLHGDMCYRFVNKLVTYDEATCLCAADRSLLALPKDLDNDDFIRSLPRNNSALWLAATDRMSEGHWKNEHNLQALTFGNWYSGQPDNHGGDEHCAWVEHSKYGGWNDVTCSSFAQFVCQREALPSSVVNTTAPRYPILVFPRGG